MRRGFGLVGVGLLQAPCGGLAGVVETPAASHAAPTPPSPRVNAGAGHMTGTGSVVSAMAIACAELRGG